MQLTQWPSFFPGIVEALGIFCGVCEPEEDYRPRSLSNVEDVPNEDPTVIHIPMSILQTSTSTPQLNSHLEVEQRPAYEPLQPGTTETYRSLCRKTFSI